MAYRISENVYLRQNVNGKRHCFSRPTFMTKNAHLDSGNNDMK